MVGCMNIFDHDLTQILNRLILFNKCKTNLLAHYDLTNRSESNDGTPIRSGQL